MVQNTSLSGSLGAVVFFFFIFSHLFLTHFANGQPVFEPPYNKLTVGLMVVGVVCTGYGTMFYGLSHQQKKQGYWK